MLGPTGARAATGTAAPSADLVVAGPAGSVVITRHPYRLQVLDTAGRPRLSEVANPGAGPTAYASTRPTPLGSTNGQTAPLVAPLVLTVGTAADAAYPGSPFAGNLLAGAATGVQYSATDVVSATPDGSGGQVVVVGSNAPTGKQFTVHVAADGQRFRIDSTVTGGTGGTSASGAGVGATSELLGDSFDAPAGAAYHGFGGRHESTNLRGTQFLSYLQEENFGAGAAQPAADAAPGTGGQGYLFPNGPSAAYYVQPQFVSGDYGLLDDQTDLLSWRMATPDTPTTWQLTAAATSLHLVVAPADPVTSIGALTEVTGRQPVPPAWALQPMIDRSIYVADTPATYQAKVASDIDHLAAGDAPDSGYRIEGWAVLAPADLAADLARLARLHIHALLYFRSFAAEDAAMTEAPTVFTDAVAHGYGATTAAGTPYITTDSFGGPAVVIDFSNPAARAWYAGRITAALDLGADGFMTDFGEEVQPDMHFADGQTGATMHNQYPVLYQRLVAQTVGSYEASHPGRAIWYFNRTGYAHSAGFERGNFPGDETTDFSASSGLASQAADVLNRGIGGAYGFTTDIGGYEDATTGATTSELLLRWAEWAVLSPVFRLHGSAGQGTHVPWSYDPATLAAYRRLAQLREQVAPLVARLWATADTAGAPVTTPLWLAYPGDPVAARQDQEWLLGPDVLAAPVVTAGATTEHAYLPAGCWTYQPTGTDYPGGQYVTVPAPVDTLSWFTRCGSAPLAGRVVGPLPGTLAGPLHGAAAAVAPAARQRDRPTATPARSRPTRAVARRVATTPSRPRAIRSLASTGGPGTTWLAAVLLSLALLLQRRRRLSPGALNGRRARPGRG